jgi:hypothetical protein
VRRFGFPVLAWIGVLLLAPLRAQNIHIVSIKGDVAVTRGEGDQSVARSAQATLVTGDRVVTGEKSQVEMELDPSNSLRLGPEVGIRLGEVYPGRCQILLDRGSLTWQAQDAATVRVEIQTPSVAMRADQPGLYSVGVNAKAETEIAVRDGMLEVYAPTGSQWVGPGQKMLARGLPSDPEFRRGSISGWRRLFTLLSNMQLGAVASSFSSGDGSNEKHRVPVHLGNGRGNRGSSHPSPPSGRAHSGGSSRPAPAASHSAAAAASHSAPAAAGSHSAPAASHK